MGTRICLLIVVLIIIIIGLIMKIYLLKKSAAEIEKAFCEKIAEETNTLIDISSRDPRMLELAHSINIQLKELYRKRQHYEHGDLELKEAITNISHDLRTPLTAISGYLQLAKREKDPETVKDYLIIIENRTAALKQLTGELFQYTIAVSENEELPLKSVSLNSALEEAVSTFYAVLKQNKIVPDITMPDKKIVRQLNENALSRIFNNILNNAVKYSDGDLQIVLSADGGITFSNHASGLTEIQVARLFDRFYTVNTARESTGLGLSIAKILVERMGGTISAEYNEKILSIHIRFGN